MRRKTTACSKAAVARDVTGSRGEEQHSIAMIERHTKAAHDGVIDMLTAKASKLGASLERTIVAKKDAEERTHKLQRHVEEEEARRNYLEQLSQQREVEAEALERANADLRWEADALRANVAEVENRSNARMQDETHRRMAWEETLRQEHAVAKGYLAELYPEGLTVEESCVIDVLVREARGLEEALRERDASLRAAAERLDELAGHLTLERESREAEQSQMAVAQERAEATKQKARQLSAQLDFRVQENEALRSKLRAADEDEERRHKAVEERKARAQQRKRGDMRDTMADSKAKDDRIKALETQLMQDRARLEEELHAARSDYEESARESRRKTAKLHKRCMELEYRLANQQKPEAAADAGIVGRGFAGISSEAGEKRPEVLDTTTDLISATSLMPWWRESNTSVATPTTSTATTGSSGGRQLARLSAAHLPDPSRNNDGAPAWMRADLASDRVDLD